MGQTDPYSRIIQELESRKDAIESAVEVIKTVSNQAAPTKRPHKAISSGPGPQDKVWTALTRHKRGGLTHREIVEATGVPSRTVNLLLGKTAYKDSSGKWRPKKRT